MHDLQTTVPHSRENTVKGHPFSTYAPKLLFL